MNKFYLSFFVVGSIVYAAYSIGFDRAESIGKAASVKQLKQTLAANKIMHDYVNQLDEKHSEEMLNAQITIDDTLAAIRTGKRRLFVRTNTGCGVPKASKASSMDNAETRAELDKDVAEQLIRLTKRGDKAIIQLTACQAYITGVLE